MTTITNEQLKRAKLLLSAAGYDTSNSSNDERLILAVTAESDDDAAKAALDEIRSIVGDGYLVEYTGDGNTESDGYSTYDVAIHVAETAEAQGD